MSSSETRCVAVGSTNKVKVNACRISFERAFSGDAIDVQGFSTSSGVPAQPVGDAETRRGAVNRALAAAAAWEAAHGRAPDFSVGLEGGVYYEPAFRPTPEVDGSGRTGGPTAGVAAAASDGAAAAPPPAGETMWCCAWMAVYEPATGSWGYGRTGSFQLPNVLMSLVRGGARGGGRRRGQAWVWWWLLLLLLLRMLLHRPPPRPQEEWSLVMRMTWSLGASDPKRRRGASCAAAARHRVACTAPDPARSRRSVGLLTRGLINRTVYYEHAMILALAPFMMRDVYAAAPRLE